VHEGVLITKRRLLLKASAVMPDQLKGYKIFQKAISDYHNTYIVLHSPADVAAISPTDPPRARARPLSTASPTGRHAPGQF